jgi:hypothetical protein
MSSMTSTSSVVSCSWRASASREASVSARESWSSSGPVIESGRPSSPGRSGTRRRSASLSRLASDCSSRSLESAVYHAHDADSHHDASSVDFPKPASATTTVSRRWSTVAIRSVRAGRARKPAGRAGGRIFAIGVRSTPVSLFPAPQAPPHRRG